MVELDNNIVDEVVNKHLLETYPYFKIKIVDIKNEGLFAVKSTWVDVEIFYLNVSKGIHNYRFYHNMGKNYTFIVRTINVVSNLINNISDEIKLDNLKLLKNKL